MPHFSRHNDAVRYPIETDHSWFTQEQFNKMCDALQKMSAATATAWTMPSTLRMITLDTIPNGSYVSKVIIPEEWRSKNGNSVD